MKRFILILTALILAASVSACGNKQDVILDNGSKIEEVVVEDNLKLAGIEAGNEAVAYTFRYPEDWTMIRNTATIELQYDCNESELYAEYATVTTMAFDLSAEDINLGAIDYWKKYKGDHEKLFDEFKELDKAETKLGGDAAYKVKYSGKINGSTYVSEQIICCKAGTVYLVTLVSPKEYHDDINSVLTDISKSFKFKK